MTEALGIIETLKREIAGDGSYIITLNGAIKLEISTEGNVVAHACVQKWSRAAPKSKKFSSNENSVSVHGAKIELAAGELRIYTKGSITVKAVPGSDAASVIIQETALEIGQKMDDGTIFAGISPSNGCEMFVTPGDLKFGLTTYCLAKFNDLGALTAKFNRQSAKKNFGHDDWRVPTRAELNVLYENYKKGFLRKAFKRLNLEFGGWYWSSTSAGPQGAWRQRLSNGEQRDRYRGIESAVRLVRG